ncbi:hypothetical protein PILCRDRAFT_237508 [Piloderma croceum F 1598]|uniref:Uncharacterized protein n=1 Tax=Piloderma croceum (strain F 1598) TaxID=765440 RepID=A0A0C3FX07_PILCF|nr:hypothetical protein PILCRDRAFT_237508 [Piloderma croceum F 1598]
MEEMPWNRASTMMDDLVSSQNPDSSAWIIRNAHREFTEGVEIMKLTKSRDEGDRIGYEGQPTALSTISNGILRDPRAFYMTDPKAWFEMYDRQVTFENSVRRGWLHGGARKVKKEALERLNSSGWDDLRPALRMTISGWFMKAFMCASTHQHVTAVELYHRAVEILEWGRQMWSNVPQHTRGPIFDLTYIRAVKRFYMTSIMQAHATHGKSNSEFNLEEAVELAHAIIADVNANPPGPNPIPPLDPGTLLSFWTYPKAEALAYVIYHTIAHWFIA